MNNPTRDVRHNWPMPAYIHSWQLFRQLSDENKETAEALLAQRHWPHRPGLRIVDVGCGDGKLLRELLGRIDTAGHRVALLDPDAELLAFARREIDGLQGISADQVDSINSGIEDAIPKVLEAADAVLAVHVVYLMDDGVFEAFVRALPRTTPLYVVLDNPGSVFSTLWKQSAPEFLRRVELAHDLLRRLASAGFEVNRSEIVSRLENPLLHANDGVRRSLISMLCYDDSRDMTVEALAEAEKTIQRFVRGLHVRCESACYEIIRP